MKLRQYQIDLVNSIKMELRRGSKSICAVAPCGSGKSVIQGIISKSANDKGNRVLFIVHRKELLNQIHQTFDRCGVNFTLTTLGMVQTLVRNLDDIVEPSIIITDETHHSLAKSYTDIYDKFPRAIRIGFTATPTRLKEGGLGRIYSSMVNTVSTKWLIENKFLSPYKLFSVKLADTTNLHVKRGEFDTKEVEELMDNKFIYGETYKMWNKLAKNKKTIIYCSSIETSKNTIKKFGDIARHLDGKTPKLEREKVVQDFRDGKITVLSNVDLFGEGFDVPDCECVILLRPTKSLSLFIQQSMRSMRYKENKEAIIIDHVGNCFEHGLPDDDNEWELEEKKKNKESEIKIKECPNCCAVHNKSICPNCELDLNKWCEVCEEYGFKDDEVCFKCGGEFKTKLKKDKKVLDVELVEIKSNMLFKTIPYNRYKKCKSHQELKAFGKLKGYKSGWAYHKAIEMGFPVPERRY